MAAALCHHVFFQAYHDLESPIAFHLSFFHLDIYRLSWLSRLVLPSKPPLSLLRLSRFVSHSTRLLHLYRRTIYVVHRSPSGYLGLLVVSDLCWDVLFRVFFYTVVLYPVHPLTPTIQYRPLLSIENALQSVNLSFLSFCLALRVICLRLGPSHIVALGPPILSWFLSPFEAHLHRR